MEKKAGTAAGKKNKDSIRMPRVSVTDVRRRAYEIFLERGGIHGHDIDDWLKAEKELKSKK